MSTELNVIFEIVSKRLPEVGVDCVMIGGYAVNHYGFTRATQDVDFMIAASDEHRVRQLMKEAGFTGVSSHENVVFFHYPGFPLRVDFLKVDRETMDLLMAQAIVVEGAAGIKLRVPCLLHLIAMKLFAMKSGSPKRLMKDLPDIVQLTLRNDLDVVTDIKPLCDRYGSDDLYDRICEQIEVWRNA